MPSGQSFGVQYKGKPIEGKSTYYWKVRLKDKDGNVSPYSSMATFETGLLTAKDWKAKWIYIEDHLIRPFFDPATVNYKDSSVHPLYDKKNWSGNTWLNLVEGKLLRKEFQVADKEIKRARVFVANLGYYELRINGRKVGDHVLDPGFTDCSQRVLSVTYDVKGLLREGSNAIGVMLSNGRLMNCKDGFRLELEVEYTDGEKYLLLSNESWKGTLDAPFKSVINWGISKELYDATKELPGWDKPGFNERNWNGVKVKQLDLNINAQLEPIRIVETIEPVQLIKISDSIYRYNMGQNFSGWASIKVKGPRGKIIKVQYSDSKDRLMDFNQEDTYMLKGEGMETFQPRFTYHGFQWVTLIGYPGVPDISTIKGCVVHTDLRKTGSFSCSDSLLNRLYNNNI